MHLLYKETDMKKIIIPYFIIFSLLCSSNVFGKTKQVCKDTKDKHGKVTHTCKTIKIHKKLDGKTVSNPKTRMKKNG